jgi:glycosyltransferase involved in cell wall biosynthesis
VNVPFEGFGKLRNRAIELTSHDWIVSIDTDERSTPEFAEEVRQTVAAPRHDAYFVPRHNTFLGRPLRHSGMYPDYRQPQVFRKDKLRYLEDMVHEGFECRGTVGHFKNYIWQHPWPSLKVLNAKSERYTTLMAQKNYETGRRASLLQLMVHPAAAFMKRYLFQLGFLDGTAGFVVAATHSHYTFMKYAKVWELRNSRKA